MLRKAGHQYVIDEQNDISLEATGPYSFVYKNNDHSATLSSEPLLENDEDTYTVCVYLSDLDEWDEPKEKTVTTEEKETIADFVAEAISLLGLKVEIE